MYWLVVVLTISGTPDIKMEFPFTRSTYCNFALKKMVERTPTTTIKGKEVKTAIKKAVCEEREAST
ncbi:MAG: hypothetical protein CMA64_07085 [Euryarchaeota archaeon]|nr:hypothetical protein [Euryarchaeota archaeon]|tara:strand:+ start:147 stop:344 length:198 start_codon:yes stop_codon:yes gene_type:complete